MWHIRTLPLESSFHTQKEYLEVLQMQEWHSVNSISREMVLRPCSALANPRSTESNPKRTRASECTLDPEPMSHKSPDKHFRNQTNQTARLAQRKFPQAQHNTWIRSHTKNRVERVTSIVSHDEVVGSIPAAGITTNWLSFASSREFDLLKLLSTFWRCGTKRFFCRAAKVSPQSHPC